MENAKPKLTKPEAMIFDMDGTLFKTETLLVPVFHQVFDRLREERLYEGETPPEELILSCLGMLLPEIWKRVLPDQSEEVRRRADELLLELELAGLKELPSELYPQVRETLTRLKERGVRLFVASNGLEHYVKGVADTHGILPLFEGLYSAGEYQTASKVDLVKLLLDNHAIRTAWMVGDRSSDVEAGKKNGQTVIGCAYAGFGNDRELAGADALIGAFKELLELYDEAANHQ
ncbi:HAD hydrolase-like protein [Paenibacillus macerans]|uniref:HAD hydrolase-like protein n=2 Tax=Paenibacillus macerans TaxID=44252 RepID=A0A6N8EWU9_PAEMA|nr:HAD hydrolase-like protein [Paenibacillus macerans]MBS5912467.1 HAD hydrolase-like protein [Paenibacillus macerans]MCY7559228.1 HAD hydrolase-like protein [Paenibacillus macerans]MDU5948874.1 HAD hydrolase-like protein [Paenibacillus macerans]MEC0138719.1 HAD hydrolase-like protein [Paenibacillus macerans]MEC0149192.1 HAD hydrolase-like protein [Paenibacillus macerans]